MSYAVANNSFGAAAPVFNPENAFLDALHAPQSTLIAANQAATEFNQPVAFGFDEGILPKSVADDVLKFIVAFRPTADNILNWNGKKDNLDDVSYVFRFGNAQTNDSLARQDGVSINADATTMLGEAEDGSKIILTEIFADRIYFDENGKQRPDHDILARLIVASAHEIYGNTTRYLQGLQDGVDFSKVDRRSVEINAFQAGIDYINRMKAHSAWEKLSPEFREALEQALVREQEGLESWKSAPSQ
jgi:hypothetical protein